MPQGAKVGTSSLRRKSQILKQRPDLQIIDLRGNVGTRLAKLDDGQYDAIILASAGLKRLGIGRTHSPLYRAKCKFACGWSGRSWFGMPCR